MVLTIVKIFLAFMGIAFVVLWVVALFNKRNSVYGNNPNERNPMEGKKVVFVEDLNDIENADGVRGHLIAIGMVNTSNRIYDKFIKRFLDIFVSYVGMVLLSPLFIIIMIAIMIDDPGPVLFTQKRIGMNKQYFKLHKFRSMKMCTPHDVPTHMLDNPEQYITRVGKFIRAHSLDELPQIWDIFIGNMSIIGPRPGLWNQDLLVAERDKYNANNIKPGLTGWAQINGRDELEIFEKAKLDGEYVIRESFSFDIRCFVGTLGKVKHDDSVVEGNQGRERNDVTADLAREQFDDIGFGEKVTIDRLLKKRVLITGANSYIGRSFAEYAGKHYQENFFIDECDMLDANWRKKDFSEYEVVFHVAGLAHADIEKFDQETKEHYYKINTDLAIEVCNKAKQDGVKLFVLMSSMIIYGESSPYRIEKVIDRYTVPQAANVYGDSKLQADIAVRKLATDYFKVIVLRPPMIYGRYSKGNYPMLSKIAKKTLLFPNISNNRSMLYIENLCELLCQIFIIKGDIRNATVLVPQNKEWTKTSQMVRDIAEANGKRIIITSFLNFMVYILSYSRGKVGKLTNKAFGNSVYSHEMSEISGIDYQVVSLKESILRTEADEESDD